MIIDILRKFAFCEILPLFYRIPYSSYFAKKILFFPMRHIFPYEMFIYFLNADGLLRFFYLKPDPMTQNRVILFCN